MTRDWSSLQKKKLAVRAMKNATKENLSAKREALVVVMTIESHSVVTTVKNLSEENLKTMKDRQDVVFQRETMKKETKRNLSVAVPENLLARENHSASVSTVTKNVQEAAAGVIAARKTLSSTVHAPQARSA